MVEPSRWRGVSAWIIAGAACGACHGERPDVLAPPADSAVPGLLGPKSAQASPPPPDAGADAAPPDAAAPVGTKPTAEPPEAPRTLAGSIIASSVARAVAANNAFAVALFEQVRTQSAKQNLLTSPISAELALTMAYAGAAGQTRTEMASALRFGAAPAQTIFDGQNALSQALQGRGAAAFALAASDYRGSSGHAVATDYQLQVVNSVWGQTGYAWEAPFLHTLAADYGATVYKRDFRTQWEPARQEINAWVSTQTSDKINDLLPPQALTRATRMVLVNALHLKMPWESEFHKSSTAPAPFTRADKTQVTTPLMHTQSSFAYVDDGSAQVVSLPLAGNALSVIIALPHAGSSLEAYERSLRAGSAALMQPKKTALVNLSLPKSAFTSPTFSLSDALKALGMKQAFDDQRANFEGMCAHTPEGEPLYVSDVLQKTMLDVQETGVEAAAATAVVTSILMSAVVVRTKPVPVPMIVNRPYLVAIVDVPTGAILMLGHITDPSAAAGN